MEFRGAACQTGTVTLPTIHCIFQTKVSVESDTPFGRAVDYNCATAY